MKDPLPDLFDVRSVYADHEGFDGFDAADKLWVRDVVCALAPSGHAFVGFDANEDPRHGGWHLNYVCLYIGDLHGRRSLCAVLVLGVV